MYSQASSEPVMCEVCGAYIETRRGLAIHARVHLRQLGVAFSETSGAPVELLYQFIKERDGSLPYLKVDSPPRLTPNKQTSQQEFRTPSVPEDKSCSSKVRTMDKQDSPGRCKESAALLRPASPALRLAESSTSSSLEHQTTMKPLWAPLETDAPITLASSDNSEIHVCQLCGCWYETRKGLSSHARSHLRQIGIADSAIKGSAIDFLYQIMEEEDLKPISADQQQPSLTQRKRALDASPPSTPSPGKRGKSSDEYTCILCGETFEHRKGLSSHARSHLRQIGVLDFLGKNSAIDTVKELVSSGVLEAVQPPKLTSTPSLSAAPSPAPKSPAGPPRSPGPGHSWSPPPRQGSAKSPPPLVSRAPKAKKGFRLAVDPLHRKPKPEPVEMDVSAENDSSSSSSTPAIGSSLKSPSTDGQSPPTVICDFCGQLFDTRKALSCHARAHLRQLGLSWSIKTSPLDLLKEVMTSPEDGSKVSTLGGPSPSGKSRWTPEGSKRTPDSHQSGEPESNSCSSPLDYSLQDNPPSGKCGAPNTDRSCELCGFDFVNRKALASHARAHLRQLGVVEWKAVEGASSPIELLGEIIRRDPAKVAAVFRRYRMGDLYIKKKAAALPSLATHSDALPVKPSAKQSEHKFGRENSSRKGHTQTHGSPGVRSPRDLHPLKQVVPAGEENENSISQQPSRPGSIPAMLPKPPLTPLVKLVGKVYSLKCRFCEKVFHGPLSIQEEWIMHLQKHILSLGYKGKASPPAAQVAAPALIQPVAV